MNGGRFGRELRFPEDGPLIQGEIRPLLRWFGCPKSTPTARGRWIIDREMEQGVMDLLHASRRAS